ncbi:MAG: EAL domain-containing protein [Epsilonproteobacteria bacterium]|nr:EAL domain-containing protein [Campylobacterota bacterium]
MRCTKCHDTLSLGKERVKLFFLSQIDELNHKSALLFEKLGYQPLSSDLVGIEVSSSECFFSENIDLLSSYFNELEREEIKVYEEAMDESSNIQKIIRAKPLSRYMNLISDREFFDIINHESLTSHFQPIIDAATNTIYGYESLIRGVKEDGSLMYPDELFGKSARNDLNFKLDRLARESALKTAATKKVHQKIFINFIPTSIYDPEFCLASTVKWANQLEFDPKNIVFEVVETEHVKDQAHLKKILSYYRNEGFLIALDDVGEGYSSLNMLIELKPDIIKVDRKIICDIHKDPIKESVYRALYNIAKENGIKILAEGVESAFEVAKIQEIGIDYLQGYYFARPQPEPVRVANSLWM